MVRAVATIRRRCGVACLVMGSLVLGMSILDPAAATAAPPSGDPAATVLGVRLAPGTAGLTPELAVAYTVADRAAADRGVPLYIVSGRRSWAEQNALWRQGIREHGSPGRAQRWVLPPHRSTHVSGRAVDVGPRRGAAWLEANGHRWGLCRSFDNEWWHFEFATLPGTRCPRRLPDASRR